MRFFISSARGDGVKSIGWARYDEARTESRLRAKSRRMGALSFDSAGLELSPPADVLARFTDDLATLSLANLTDRLGAAYGARTAFVLETPLALPGITGTSVA